MPLDKLEQSILFSVSEKLYKEQIKETTVSWSVDSERYHS